MFNVRKARTTFRQSLSHEVYHADWDVDVLFSLRFALSSTDLSVDEMIESMSLVYACTHA